MFYVEQNNFFFFDFYFSISLRYVRYVRCQPSAVTSNGIVILIIRRTPSFHLAFYSREYLIQPSAEIEDFGAGAR